MPLYLFLLNSLAVLNRLAKTHPTPATTQVHILLVRHPLSQTILNGILPTWEKQCSKTIVLMFTNYLIGFSYLHHIYVHMHTPSSSTALLLSIVQSVFHPQPSGGLISSRVSCFSVFPSYSTSLSPCCVGVCEWVCACVLLISHASKHNTMHTGHIQWAIRAVDKTDTYKNIVSISKVVRSFHCMW